jgi:hypothetical protein
MDGRSMSTVVAAFDRSKLPLRNGDWRRGLIAGLAWGAALTLGLTAMTALSCGGVCLPEVAVNAGLSLIAGLLGIGPIAAYGRRQSQPACPRL